MQCPRAAIFDLDDTLAESFKAPSAETLAALLRLLEKIPVAIMTGAGFARMESQFLPILAASAHSDRLYVFPGSCAQGFAYKDRSWQRLYSLSLSAEERQHIRDVVLETVEGLDVLRSISPYGEQMFDREEQVAYTVVGFDAPLEIKKSWDPDGSKRGLLRDALREKLPEFEVLLGGSTTIDITRKNINKSYGVEWLSKHLNTPAGEMLYVGDAFYEGGNDAAVIPTGIPTRAVSSPAETLDIINDLVAACSSS